MSLLMLFFQDSNSGDAAGGVAVVLVFVVIGIVVYFIPAIVARGKRSFGSVMAINFFLGWTLVGWVVALAWALKDDPQPVSQLAGNPMLCSSCGKYSAPGSQFCGVCGAPFFQALPPPVAEDIRAGRAGASLGNTRPIEEIRDAAVQRKSIPIWVPIVLAVILIGALVRIVAVLSSRPSVSDGSAASSTSSSEAAPSSCGPANFKIDKLAARSADVGSDYFRVTGRVTNECAEATGVQLKITVFGKDGSILRAQDFWPASVRNIVPNAPTSFEWTDEVPGFDKYTIEAVDVKKW